MWLKDLWVIRIWRKVEIKSTCIFYKYNEIDKHSLSVVDWNKSQVINSRHSRHYFLKENYFLNIKWKKFGIGHSKNRYILLGWRGGGWYNVAIKKRNFSLWKIVTKNSFFMLRNKWTAPIKNKFTKNSHLLPQTNEQIWTKTCNYKRTNDKPQKLLC